jgi:drug/metabolite transporter (DMT)-like permease
VLLLPVSYFIRHRTLKIRPFIFLTLTLLCGLCVLLVFQPAVPKTGLLISILALVSYVSYSLLTEQTLHTHKIDIRYPVLLFQSGLMLGVVGLFLIPFQPWNQLFSPVSALSILYVFFCVFVPHACFNAVLNKMKFRYITDVFLAEVPIAMFFENALLGIALPASIYFLVAAIICTILLLRWRTVQMMVMEA